MSCIRDAKIFIEKRITCHIVLFPGFKLIMLFLDIVDVISFTFGRMTSMPRTRKQLPSWVVYKLEFCQENRGMKCRGTKPQYWRARGAWKKKKKKELTSFRMVVFFVCFLPPRFLFYRMVVFFRVNDKAAKGLLPQDMYAKGWIIIVLNFFIIFELTYFSIIINTDIVHRVPICAHPMFIISVISVKNEKLCFHFKVVKLHKEYSAGIPA